MAKIDKVQEVSIDLLKPYNNNAKIHSDEQVKQIAASIQEFGFLNPCLIDKEFNVIAGHGRIMAAKSIGMTSIPCVFVEGLSESQKRAYILADNRLTEMGDWDFDKLQIELQGLDDIEFDMGALGFDSIEQDYETSSYNEYDDRDDDQDDVEYSNGKGYNISYELVFNDEQEQDKWYDFLIAIRKKMPEKETIAERVLSVVEEWMSNNA